MIKGINTSLSGLLAASTRANTAANNIVNAYNTSTPVAGDTSTAAIRTSRAYVPQRTINSSQKTGGVIATNVPINPSSFNVFNPGNPDANSDGLISVPNVSIEVEFAELRKATHAYKANAAVLRTLSDIQETALDIIK
jgi:flagellar basal-body rod protein FlgC